AGLSVGSAIVPADAAVGVGIQIAARSLARRDCAAGVTAAGAPQTAGVAVALPARVQALVLLLIRPTFAERCARVLRGPLLASRPGGPHRKRAQHGPRPVTSRIRRTNGP